MGRVYVPQKTQLPPPPSINDVLPSSMICFCLHLIHPFCPDLVLFVNILPLFNWYFPFISLFLLYPFHFPCQHFSPERERYCTYFPNYAPMKQGGGGVTPKVIIHLVPQGGDVIVAPANVVVHQHARGNLIQRVQGLQLSLLQRGSLRPPAWSISCPENYFIIRK